MKARTLIAALTAAALSVGVAPAYAGPAETAYLQKLVGIYHGEGKVTGAQAGTVSCRLVLRSTSQGHIAFNGRCALSGGSGAQSINGVIRYNDERGVYESSSQGRTVAGRKNGQRLTFSVSGNDSRGRGSSRMVFSPGSAQVQFEFVDARNGQTSKGSIPFRRS